MLFLTCELGERIASLFNELDNEIVQLEWYLFPMEVQKLLPMVMINTQESIVIQCFGSVACTRWQFKKVSTTKSNCNLKIDSPNFLDIISGG